MTAAPVSPAASPVPVPSGRRDSILYSAAVAAPRLPAILLLPALARVLSLRDMGLLATAWIFIELFQTFAGLGLKASLARHFPLAADAARRREILSTVLAGIAGGGLLLSVPACLAFAWPPARDSLAFLAAIEPAAFAALLAAAWIGNLVSAATLCFRADGRPRAFLAVGLLGAALEILLIAALLAAGRATVLNLLLAEGAKQGAMLAAVGWALRRDLAPAFSPALLRALLAFGIWMVPVGLGEWIAASSDRFWLGQAGDLGQAGVYGFLYRFAVPLGILWTGALMGLHARLYRLGGDEGLACAREGLARHLARGGALAWAFGLLLPAALLLGSRFHPVVPAPYLRGVAVFPLLVALLYVSIWGRHYALWLEYRFRTRALGFSSFPAAAASVVLVPAALKLALAFGWEPLLAAAYGALSAQLLSAAGLARLAGRHGLPGAPRAWAVGLAWVAACAATSAALALAAGLTSSVR